MMKYTIYADGSSKGNGSPNARGGWGTIIILPDGEEISLCGNEKGVTNNQMELRSVIEGLRYIKEDDSLVLVEIVTDSLYVVKGCNEYLNKWIKTNFKGIKNIPLWKELIGVCGQKRIKWTWVKGHNGHVYNEKCDSLAQAAAELLEK